MTSALEHTPMTLEPLAPPTDYKSLHAFLTSIINGKYGIRRNELAQDDPTLFGELLSAERRLTPFLALSPEEVKEHLDVVQGDARTILQLMDVPRAPLAVSQHISHEASPSLLESMQSFTIRLRHTVMGSHS